jgi:hypothetical protein
VELLFGGEEAGAQVIDSSVVCVGAGELLLEGVEACLSVCLGAGEVSVRGGEGLDLFAQGCALRLKALKGGGVCGLGAQSGELGVAAGEVLAQGVKGGGLRGPCGVEGGLGLLELLSRRRSLGARVIGLGLREGEGVAQAGQLGVIGRGGC